MDDGNNLPFSAILAGALLVDTSIDNIKLSNCLSMFENDNDMYVDNSGLNKLFGVVGRDEKGFYLIRRYDDMYDSERTVEDYLYELTTIEVRRFFGIPEKQVQGNNDKKVKPNVFKRIRTICERKTRVFN